MSNLTDVIDQAVADINDLMVWIAPEEPPGERRYPWSAAQEAELRRYYGRVSRPELARRITKILRRETGDPQAERSVVAMTIRANHLGLQAYSGEADELHLRAAADFAEVGYYYLHEQAKAGKLPTIKRGKQRYVTRRDLANWLVAYRERQLAQGEVLNRLDGEDAVTKQEAMALTGLSETHIGRYLTSGVITAWKVPDLSHGRRGEWRVQRKSALAYVESKAEGNLQAILDENPAYVEIRDKITAEVRSIRQAGRVGRPDPLSEPKSSFFPGCFTVAQVASHAGLSAQSVYKAIEQGDLVAETAVVKGKRRYAVVLDEARRYARWVAEREHPVSRYHNKQQAQIAEAGLFSVKILAERWQVSEDMVLSYVHQGGLPYRRWGRYFVFEREDVEAFEGGHLSVARSRDKG